MPFFVIFQTVVVTFYKVIKWKTDEIKKSNKNCCPYNSLLLKEN